MLLALQLILVMGNASSRKDESSPSGSNTEVGEEYMEYAHGVAHVSYHAPESMVRSPPHSPRVYPSPLMFSPQRPEMMQFQSNSSAYNTKQNEYMPSEAGIQTMITWCYEGKQVAVEGSWDGWKMRELLQKSGDDFTIRKVLPWGVYLYRFIVDGHLRYSPDSPHERDDLGNVFNVLDLKDRVPEVLNNISMSETPPSPVSSYKNSPFSSEDYNEKLPELPPLLQHSLLDQPSSFESLDKPLPAVLNHLYIQKGRSSQSFAALSSTHRFRSKYVTVVLYKPVKK